MYIKIEFVSSNVPYLMTQKSNRIFFSCLSTSSLKSFKEFRDVYRIFEIWIPKLIQSQKRSDRKQIMQKKNYNMFWNTRRSHSPECSAMGMEILPHLQMGVAVIGFVEDFLYGLHNL